MPKPVARPVSDEELQLKKRARRRLVGALVLVTAVAVILPMVLDSEPRPVTQNVDIQIPSPDAGEFKPKASAPPPVASMTPLKGMPAPTKAAPSSPDPAAKAESAAASAKADAAAEKGESRTAAKEAPKATPKDAPKTAADGGYVVQVAALADDSKVKQLQKQMSAAGIKPYTEAITTKTGEITRVRAGPYATREAAESARTQLKKAGLDGKVVPK